MRYLSRGKRAIRSRGLSAALASAAAMIFTLAVTPGIGRAATPGPGWRIESFALPTSFSEGDNAECAATAGRLVPLCDTLAVIATNAGSRPMDGSQVTLRAAVPAGLSVQKVLLFWSGASKLSPGYEASTNLAEKGYCTTTPVQCSLPAEVEPDGTLQMLVKLVVSTPGTHGIFQNEASISGGGAPEASTDATVSVGGAQPLFGPALVNVSFADADGTPYNQAGGHPYELTTRIVLNNGFRVDPEAAFTQTSIKDVKDVVVNLPLGLVGSALSASKCTLAQLSSPQHCPSATVVGHILSEPRSGASVESPIYNLVPEEGEPAEFGYIDALKAAHAMYVHVVPTPAGYVLQVVASEVPQVALTSVVVVFYGDPAERDQSGNTPVATLTSPADCSEAPVTTSVHVDSWQEPGMQRNGTPDFGDSRWVAGATQSPPVTGCNLLQFDPSLSVKPDTTSANSPSGLNVEVKVPQTENPATLATPPLKNATVTLPAGLTADPSAASGLAACSEAQIGWLGGSLSDFTPAAPTCPPASKIGTVELTSPLLEGTLEGAIFLASQEENPFHSLLAGYIVVDDRKTGIVVKIPGELETNQQTGQITGTFDQNPQLPFSDLKLRFFGGTRGDLATPESCGTYTTTSDLEPWSAPDSGPNATPSDAFQINSGCVSGFTPAFSAGTASARAGAYSPFTLSFSRSDSEEGLAGISVSLPPGLLAKIAGVAECPEAAISAAAARSGAAEQASPSCPDASRLGTVRTAAGPGPNPTLVTGSAYLTGPYKGAPYGMAVIVPALAGPFDLGTVVIRQALYIDPHDSHVTAVSDLFPRILKGIPLRLKQVDVTLDRPGFTFNPTSCEPTTIHATLGSLGGASTASGARFQVGGCGELPFNPSLAASTQARTSKANGASLTVKVAQKPGEANIHKVGLQLPISLPSRLSTLNKACTEAQFNTNPAGCPAGSLVGTAVARTPVLNVPLTGPAYIVSHGGAEFPDLEFVLQGEGVTIDLDGKTQIKKGITYSRFETVPDAPITSFETSLPEGPHSILAAYGNLCAPTSTVIVKKQVTRRVHGKRRRITVKVRQTVARPLVMPTTIVGQNGAQITRTTPIAVSGCPRASVKKTKKAQQKRKSAKHARQHG